MRESGMITDKRQKIEQVESEMGKQRLDRRYKKSWRWETEVEYVRR
jgi:hypothetical protein